MSKPVVKITASLNRESSRNVFALLRDVGVKNIHIEAGRASTLLERRGFRSLFSNFSPLNYEPVEIYSFLVDEKDEESAMHMIINEARLYIPGMGSIYSEKMVHHRYYEPCEHGTVNAVPVSRKAKLYEELMGICCIVQKGNGDLISRIVLDSGACVPIVTYGTGTGLRDKLGLLRITIPADKEVINLVVSSYDAEVVMDFIFDAARLDQPGKGFLYLFPVRKGIINTRISHGQTGHAATMEQIIAAMDALNNGMEWRRRGGGRSGRGLHRFFVRNLTGILLECDDDKGKILVEKAKEAGVVGATISKVRVVSRWSTTEPDKIPKTREICNMIVPNKFVPKITLCLEEYGAFTPEYKSSMLTFSVSSAFNNKTEKKKD